jgi:hypothetical protein
LIAPAWNSGSDWDGTSIKTEISRDAFHASPVFDLSELLYRHWELRPQEHFSRIGQRSRDKSVESTY